MFFLTDRSGVYEYKNTNNEKHITVPVGCNELICKFCNISSIDVNKATSLSCQTNNCKRIDVKNLLELFISNNKIRKMDLKNVILGCVENNRIKNITSKNTIIFYGARSNKIKDFSRHICPYMYKNKYYMEMLKLSICIRNDLCKMYIYPLFYSNKV